MMRSSSERPSPALAANAYRRMWIVIVVYSAIGVVVAGLVNLPLGLQRENWRQQAWLTVGFVAANAIMTVYRVDRNNALRRTNETLTEMLYVVGLFWLAPWALVLGRPIAGFAAWHFTKMRWQFRVYNAVMYAIVSMVLVRAYLWLAPTSAHDGWRAVAAALAVWLLNDIIRIGGHVVLDGVRHDRFRLDVLWPSINTSYLRLIACAFGLLIAAALEQSPWNLTAVATVGVLFVVVSRANSRAASLDAGIDQISKFSAATADAQLPDQVERELLRSVEAFGRLETVATARAEGLVDVRADDRLEWNGRRRPGVVHNIRSPSDLSALAAGSPTVTVDRKGTIAAWSLDPVRDSYLVVESAEVSADQSDLWTTVGHLVDHARLAIDTVYKSQRLTDLAEKEYQRARSDPLTGLPNRLAVLGEISELLSRPNPGSFSLVLIEWVGYHESVNVLGLDFGDSAIVSFAESLVHLQARGEVEYVAHVSAAQFVLIVSADAAGARAVAERACAGPKLETPELALADPFGQRVAVAGIATSGQSAASAEELLRAASIALDRATHDEQIASFGPADAVSAERRMAIRFRLGAAIDLRQIVPEFQPQVVLANGQVSGCEVLARWDHTLLGQVQPSEFISVSERSGQIERLTIAIAEQALDAARYWGDGEPLDLSLNVSARSLDSPAFLRALSRLFDEASRSPTSTTIEITESMLVDRASMMLALERMRELGFRISIDDFGTGYSALSYLDRLPVDEVKIDQAMVAPIAPDNPVSPVVSHLIELCQALGLSVCAEGIEDQYQLDVLRSLGCDVGQGYLISRSLSADAMTTWLAANRIAHAEDMRSQSSVSELFHPRNYT